MLNIPEEVKALFKTDSAFKNFSVHFPNEECRELNNDDILTESVSFTESLCSQETFRFGLTEASEIKFTAINIPNIRGVTIECALDISIDRMADPAQFIQDHTPTGNEVFLEPHLVNLTCQYPSDLSGYAYRIPYGRFIVDTCPRNHESMAKREVTGYTERLESDSIVNTAQYALMNAFFPNVENYTPIAKQLAYAVLFNNDPAGLLNVGYTRTSAGSGGAPFLVGIPVIENTFTVIAGGQSKTLTFKEDFKPHVGARGTILGVEITDVGADAYIEDIAAKLQTLGVDAQASGYSSLEELAEAGANGLYHFYAVLIYGVDVGEQTPKTYHHLIELPMQTCAVYHDGFNLSNGGAPASNGVYLGGGVQITLGTSSPVTSRRYSESAYGYTDGDTSELATHEVMITPTLQSKIKITIQGTDYTFDGQSFTNAVSLPKMAAGALELQCRFASPARLGGLEVTELDNATPVLLQPADYSSLWYDETVISPIGYANIRYKNDAGEEQETTVQIGTGYSEYNLTENEVLNNTVFEVTDAEVEHGITVKDKITDFLTAVFTPNIPDLSFVPIELQKKGLPYLEAGDALSITTNDAQTVPSFILRQTIAGIQFLQAEVESANGEAMEIIET